MSLNDDEVYLQIADRQIQDEPRLSLDKNVLESLVIISQRVFENLKRANVAFSAVVDEISQCEAEGRFVENTKAALVSVLVSVARFRGFAEAFALEFEAYLSGSCHAAQSLSEKSTAVAKRVPAHSFGGAISRVVGNIFKKWRLRRSVAALEDGPDRR